MKFTKLDASLKFTARGFSTKMGNLYFAQAFKSFILLKGGVLKIIQSAFDSNKAFDILE